MSGVLYLVGTPIGNLGDISPRALETLQMVDFIAAEDTRVSLKLLNYFEIKKPLVSYFAHNQRASGERLLERLLAGESCALITDAGMPGISDPGEEMVALCKEHRIQTICIPGPAAFVAALVLSGLPTGRFVFEGFLSAVPKKRRSHLKELEAEGRTMIFYEAPHKLLQTLEDMAAVFGDREISICRELTKRYEEVRHTSLFEAIAAFRTERPRGEFVLVVAGAKPVERDEAADLEQACAAMEALLLTGVRRKDAARQVAEEMGVSKNLLYSMSVKEDA